MQPRIRPKRSPKLILPVIMALAFFLLSAWGLVDAFMPNFTLTGLPEGPRMVLEDNPLEYPPLIDDGEFLVPVEEVERNLDPHLVWDSSEGRIIITTAEQVVRLRSDSLTAYVNQAPMDLEIPVRTLDEAMYLPLQMLENIYGVKGYYHETTGVLTLDLPGVPVQTGVTNRDAFLRQAPSIKAPLLSRLPGEAPMRIYGEEQGHYRVRTGEGLLGYVDKSRVTLGDIAIHAAERLGSKEPWRPMGQKINLTWEHVGAVNPDTRNIPDMPGLNVISPTWFALADASGRVSSRADIGYVEWAHDNGYQVWGLVNNRFDPELTAEFIRDADARDTFIRQMLAYAALYHLDGINMDFENMYQEDAQNYVQLLRELVPPAHEQGLVISVDVTVLSSSPTWSLCYDRTAIAQVVDYVMLMAYDQYAGGSRVAGPVADLPWTEWTVRKTLEEVPPERLVLGIPFYVRIWKEDSDGKVSSTAYGIGRGRAIMEEKGATILRDEKTGLYYGEYREDGAIYRAWLEDEDSLKFRLELVNKYGLAGVASWRRGLEPQWVWPLIHEALRGPL